MMPPCYGKIKACHACQLKLECLPQVLINAGQANAATGDAGYEDCLKSAEAVAKELGIETDQVLIESTGLTHRRPVKLRCTTTAQIKAFCSLPCTSPLFRCVASYLTLCVVLPVMLLPGLHIILPLCPLARFFQPTLAADYLQSVCRAGCNEALSCCLEPSRKGASYSHPSGSVNGPHACLRFA